MNKPKCELCGEKGLFPFCQECGRSQLDSGEDPRDLGPGGQSYKPMNSAAIIERLARRIEQDANNGLRSTQLKALTHGIAAELEALALEVARLQTATLLKDPTPTTRLGTVPSLFPRLDFSCGFADHRELHWWVDDGRLTWYDREGVEYEATACLIETSDCGTYTAIVADHSQGGDLEVMIFRADKRVDCE